MSEQTMRALESTARWCREQYKGILTPTGKPKKIPTYLIVKCVKCGDLTLQKKRSYVLVVGDDGKRHREEAGPLPCDAMKYSPRLTKDKGRPHSVFCQGRVEPVREIGELK